MTVHGPHPAEDTNLAFHILNRIVQSLPNQCFVIILAAQDVPFNRDFLQLFVHHVVAKLAFFLHQS